MKPSRACVFLLLLTVNETRAASQPDPRECVIHLLKKNHERSAPFRPGIQKWLDWETTTVIEAFKPEFKTSKVPLCLVPKSSVTLLKSSTLDPLVERTFIQGDLVLWPKHPYNTVETTPFFKVETLSEALTGHHTASRSMVVELEGRPVGLKMPTNRPFGPSRPEQINKAFPKDSMRSSMRRTEIIERIDAELGRDPDLILLKDVLTVTENQSGHGFSVRDLSPLEDGHYYFPAHLIPVEGETLAKKNGQNLASFFKEAWAAPLGRVQAKLLVRYGMEFNPINPQNFLIQLDSHFKPTGKLACRDLGDAFQVDSVTNAIGLGEELLKDRALGLKTFQEARPATKAETLTWGFNLSGKNLLLPVTREAWLEAHDLAFLAELEKLTGIRAPKGYGAYAIDPLLARPENQAALRKFHQK